MNFLGGGERHNSADYRSSSHSSPGARSADPDMSLPGGSLVDRPGDVRHFIHKKIFGGIKGVVGGFLKGGPIGAIGGGLSGFLGGGTKAIPQLTGCPPGFFATPQGCAPLPSPSLQFAPVAPPTAIGFGQPGAFPQPTRMQEQIRREQGLAVDPAAGVPVMGQFGAGTEPEVFDTMVRRCPRKAVLGADGICYNRGDLRNSDRWWPRGRRPLLTGGDMRAISTASSAAKKLQRKQKQLQSLGLLKKPAARSRPQLLPGHRAELRHASGHE